MSNREDLFEERLRYLERKSVEHDFQIDLFARNIDMLIDKLNLQNKEIKTFTQLKKDLRQVCGTLSKDMYNLETTLKRLKDGRI